MSDKKISALTSLAQGDVAASTDVLPIVDTSATETKKITASALVGAGMTAGVTNVDINSGSIDGTTIGANSAAAGTFTNLTASGTVSFSGATVSNGGAVTTIDINGGTIDATSIGASSASTGAFTTLTTSSTVTLNGGTANGVLYLNGSKVATSGNAFVFDGTNVGIGTASPDANFKLDVQAATGRIKLTSTTGTNSVVYQANNTGGTLNVGIDSSTGGSLFGVGAYAAGVWYSGNYPLVFGVNNAEGFRLTSSTLYTASGINVGIGTSSPGYKLTVAGASGSAVVNLLESGVRSWGIRAGGTVTNTFDIADFTAAATRLTIDSSGNLLVGNTTANGKLDVYKSIAYNADAALYSAIGVNDGAVNNNKVYYWRTGLTGNADGQDYVFQTLARTESSWADRARITSGGNLLVGNTSAVISSDNRLTVVGTRGGEFKSTGGASAITLDVWNNATTGDNIFVSFRTETADTQRGTITYNRTAGQVAYNVTSDVRLKDNIANAADAGNKVDALQVRQFDWKETGNHVDYGFIAQELHEVAPQAVSKPEDDEAMWSVDYSKLVPMLVKEIQSLRARVAQLESK